MSNWTPKLISPWGMHRAEKLTLRYQIPSALEDTMPVLFSKKLAKLECEFFRPFSENIGKRKYDVFLQAKKNHFTEGV